MNSQNYQTLRDSINNRQNVSADYKGYHRVMTPHTLGHKEGKEKCLLYQFDGESSSATVFPENSPANWRCIFVGELTNIKTTGGAIHTCDNHAKKQTCVDRVEIELDI